MTVARADLLSQLFLVRWEGNRWDSTSERLLRSWRPGGILLAPPNLRTPGSTAELLGKLARALDLPPFLAIEQEGGKVDPLRAFFPPLPSPRAAAENGPSAVGRLGELAGAALKLLGFNTNLAPVLDVSTRFSESTLGTRSFSADAHEVVRCGEVFIQGLRSHKILACGKYFPGLGSAQIAGGSRLPMIGKSMAELWREDLVPYRELLPQLPLVMVGHGAYKAYDFDSPRPATLSANIVEGLLRVKLGYQGVAVADNLEAEVSRRALELGEAAVRSANAGCDLLVVGGRGESLEAVLAALKKGIEFGKLSTARVAQALERIRVAKKGLASPGEKISAKDFDELAREFENFGKACQSLERKSA